MGGKPSVPDARLPADRTFIVTGANTGIGYETAKKIAKLGGRVILACRSEERAKTAIENMKKETQDEYAEVKKNEETEGEVPELNIEFMQLDLASFESTVEFARRYRDRGLPLHVLICNAGLYGPSTRMTADGFELHFQVNYLSHFLLTLLLLPLLKESAPNSRIINVSSMGHRVGELKLDNIQGQKSYSFQKFYSNSKVYQIMNMHSLARKIEAQGISIFSLDPGFVDTEIFRERSGFTGSYISFLLPIRKLLCTDTESGARTSLIAALDPKYDDKTALYFINGKPANSNNLSRNTAKQEILWRYSLQCLRKNLNDVILQNIGEKLENIKELDDDETTTKN
ncbi:Dehydrogenase/reductase SDR family member on chromosome X [Holothuria leucospilota]|uniref:Dehydrogenase/reductase SDR family member on chromosome X n=1 Tax=Holothuria leucospilota TaxID=206669 RepID=A0A9Q1BS89_HOLLE|nr:Dehydrogenase/reductase SDR family member on chromosome X [Holothuria leucospilota]